MERFYSFFKLKMNQNPQVTVLLKIDKYEYVPGEAMLPSDQRRVIEQAKFIYSSLGKISKKQTKMIEDQGEKQIKALERHGKQLLF